MPASDYGYESLNVESSGPAHGDPLLVLHGWGSSAALMQPLAHALAGTHRVYNTDLPGHGHSPPPPEPWGVPEHAALVQQLIDKRVRPETGQAAATVIGHSNGGRIALYMASTPEHADCIARLVLISPSGIAPERSLSTRMKSGLAKTLKAPFEHLPPMLRSPALDWLRHSLVWRALGSADYNALDGVMRETFVRTVNHHLDGPVHRIDVPTLLVWGENDTAVSRRQMETLEAAIPDSGLVVLEDAGHYGHLDAPDTVIAATRHFLEHA